MINTQKKILNKDYIEFSTLPIEISSRKEVAHEIEIFQLEKILDIIKEKGSSTEENVINDFYKNNFYF